MSPRVSYALVGLFVIVLGAALAGGLLWLWGGGPQADQRRYLVEVEGSVAGLSEGAPVLYQGVDVGRVERIRLHPDTPEIVRVLLSVRATTPVKQDTVAELSVRGLTGGVDINLVGSTKGSPPLVESGDAPYPVIPSQPSLLPKLEKAIPKIVDNVDSITEKLDALLGDNEDSLRRIMTNVETTTETIGAKADAVAAAVDDFAAAMERSRGVVEDVGSAAGDIRAAAADLRAAAGDVPRLVDGAQRAVGDLRGTLDEADRALRSFRAVGDRAGEVVKVVGRDLERFAGQALPETYALIVETRETVETIGRLGRKLVENPKALVFGAASPPKGPGE